MNRIVFIGSCIMISGCANLKIDTAETIEYNSDKIYINDPLPIFEDTLQTTPGNYRAYLWVRFTY